MKNKSKTQDQCTVYERNGQLVFALNSEIMVPENAPVRLTSAQLEELDYRELYRAYSPKGRKSKVDPRVMFKVMVYGYQCGIYSSRKLEEAYRYRIDFMWLLEDKPAPDHATIARFRTGRCAQAAEDLFYQYVRLLERQGETDHEAVFIDGTKLESSAGRYTFRYTQQYEEARKCLEQLNYKGDYFITHCAPNSIADKLGKGEYAHDHLTDFLKDVRKRAKFHYLLFGHYHNNKIIDDRFVLLWEQMVRVV